jgi:hypothetical protein
VRLSAKLRVALRTIGNATIGIALGMSLLVMAFVVSQFATGQGSLTLSMSAISGTALVVATTTSPPPPPPPVPNTALTSPSLPVSPTDPPSTAAPTSTSTPTPSSSPPPTSQTLSIAAYTSGGRRYAALRAPLGYVYLAPMGATVLVRTYQLIDGEVRVGSFVPSLPFFPYVTLESADRRVILRPGALNADTELLIKDGERAEPGTPLFKIVGEGASSWRTFYDRGVTANVIVSVATLPSGAEVDPVSFVASR